VPPSPSAVERWFETHQRPLAWRATYDPYHVWVSEVMAQQTRLDVVAAYFDRFVERFPDIASLAAAAEDDVVALWSGLGYYRRARMLRAGAIDVMARFGGSLPRDVDDLITIAGIGRYTAGAISSIAFEQRAAIVDGNIERILARLYGDEDPWRYAGELVKACQSPRHFNQGLMEIGALICTPRKPSCDACPLRRSCVAYATNRIDELPSKKQKAAATAMRVALYLITDRDGRILMRREAGRLMNALFHLPHGDTSLLSGKPLSVRRTTEIGSFRHTITTRRIEFQLFDAELANVLRDSGDYAWIDPGQIAQVPHPSYVTKALRLARNRGGGKRVVTRS
jgi:A/G-specific adenine glycosylase